ncbi:hypothetical protein FPE01S_01_04200 [Flavihumibacter petaseus NBRC 106054]|uniref:DUF2185 domain-containing protein n=1 Tax=Flavihumibacter petaseus NBRC 106054 TaxID=1220578 RepID=A0A0E9MVA5_9BACT|nr:hypothetical protein FPE01S_01_04200 [Flavihumibacter petaseus NBRC 106054]
MLNFFRKNPKPIFRFKESENTACITCDHVLTEKMPILYASHSADDGFWQFLCGQDNHSEENSKLISLRQATLIDPSINDLFEMPLGVGAVRESKSEIWKPFRI